MTKFNERSLHSFPLAFFYSALQTFDGRHNAIALTTASGTSTYTGSFQMPDKGTVLEIDSDPNVFDPN